MNSLLRKSFVFGFLPLLSLAAVACSSSSSEGEDEETDEGALLEDLSLDRDGKRGAQEILETKCQGNFLQSPGVALSKINYASLGADYESKTAAEKQAALMKNIEESAYPSTCRPDAGLGFISKSVLSLIVGGLEKTWSTSSDEMPKGRVKFLRPFGAAAAFEFEKAQSTPYTGVLKGGETIKGVMRFSNVGAESRSGFVPGTGFKFLIDGKPSVNMQAMYSQLPQVMYSRPDRNFFRHPHANWFPTIDEQARLDSQKAPLANKLTQIIFEKSFGSPPNRMETNELGMIEASGREVPEAERKAPRNISFKAPEELTQRYETALAADKDLDYRDFLATLEPGTIVYEAFGSESDDHNAYGTKIGVVKLSSKVVRSAWADYRLFFKHSSQKGPRQ